ncbi:transposase [uncultured Anaerococcus sp.]|uniref:transposase n=1 Tax=uncultured Anaerococcus sp. TaxID=293428 RepID=UPI0037DD99C5
MFVNAEIIIDRFHIVKLFTNSFNHTRIDTIKDYSPSNIKYKRFKKYWKHFLKPYKLLDSKYFFKLIHFHNKLVSDEGIEKKDFELFTFHLSYFKDKVSDRMKT